MEVSEEQAVKKSRNRLLAEGEGGISSSPCTPRVICGSRPPASARLGSCQENSFCVSLNMPLPFGVGGGNLN